MDYYLQDISRLEGQPKRTIADYAEQNGILVPRRFDSLAEARRSHKGIFLRSEHPQEYNGISGLLNSFSLSSLTFPVRGSRSLEEVKQRYFTQGEMQPDAYKEYCKQLGLSEDEFIKQASFSIWEKLGGLNRTVIADSSIAGRYHIMSLCYEKNNKLTNYAIVEEGRLAHEFIKPLPDELRGGLGALIETYEQVRNLGRFDPNNCPIMEFRTHNGKNYFLQYHRTRDFSPAGFMLDRGLEDGEIEVPWVRGATSKEGGAFKITVYYAGGKFDPEDEDGSFDLHWNWIFSELQFKRRRLQSIDSTVDGGSFANLVGNHEHRSKMFKPEISAVFPIESVMRDNEVLWGNENWDLGDGKKYSPRDPTLKDGETLFNFSEETKTEHNSYMNLHFVSDGRRAFVRRIG